MKMKYSKEQLVQLLQLEPHPEGGFFKETYRSEGIIPHESLPNDYSDQRNYSTGIYFLLTSENFSAFHKIHQDEMWHFYDGSPLRIHIISNEGDYTSQLVGRDLSNGELPQFVVKGGSWFASEVVEDNSFSLAGCTVAPGFDFQDFVLADRTDLLNRFPKHTNIIQKLTR